MWQYVCWSTQWWHLAFQSVAMMSCVALEHDIGGFVLHQIFITYEICTLVMACTLLMQISWPSCDKIRRVLLNECFNKKIHLIYSMTFVLSLTWAFDPTYCNIACITGVPRGIKLKHTGLVKALYYLIILIRCISNGLLGYMSEFDFLKYIMKSLITCNCLFLRMVSLDNQINIL